MKTKTIKKIIHFKIQNWIDSVEDEKVKLAIKNGAIVTGGSIASMLLGEDINDFDVYFKNKPDLMRVARYYGKDIELLDGADPKYKTELDEIKNLKETIGSENGETENDWSSQRYIALKSLDEDRLKFYGMKDFEVERCDEDSNKFLPKFISPNAITLTDKLQIVVRFWGKVDEIHKNYDFVHATNSYDFKEGKLNLRKKALESLLTKDLFYVGSKYPLTSIIRTKKFVNRGWKVSVGQYLKMMYQVSELNLNDPEVLEEQLIGVDVAYFSLLIDKLRDLKEEKMHYSYISTIIDKIFND